MSQHATTFTKSTWNVTSHPRTSTQPSPSIPSIAHEIPRITRTSPPQTLPLHQFFHVFKKWHVDIYDLINSGTHQKTHGGVGFFKLALESRFFLNCLHSAAFVYETNETRLEKCASQNNNFSCVFNGFFAESKDFLVGNVRGKCKKVMQGCFATVFGGC